MFYAQTILPVKQLIWGGSFTNQSTYVLNFMFIFYLCFKLIFFLNFRSIYRTKWGYFIADFE